MLFGARLQGAVAPRKLPVPPEDSPVQAPRPRPRAAAWGGDLSPGGWDAGHSLGSRPRHPSAPGTWWNAGGGTAPGVRACLARVPCGTALRTCSGPPSAPAWPGHRQSPRGNAVPATRCKTLGRSRNRKGPGLHPVLEGPARRVPVQTGDSAPPPPGVSPNPGAQAWGLRTLPRLEAAARVETVLSAKAGRARRPRLGPQGAERGRKPEDEGGEGPLLRGCSGRPAGLHPRRAGALSGRRGAARDHGPTSPQTPDPPSRAQPPPALQAPVYFRLGRSLPAPFPAWSSSAGGALPAVLGFGR
ncbi:translation initiation factor IF-2-like [Meles meles]|uniref:translation initiation factor IF-2-like n=1 Tax=Meles meles TaxID=9662 RepID=UPI001E6A0973|nr:translation initiation factor IF-2-like [Meles meles]